jgi:hypothetical protein
MMQTYFFDSLFLPLLLLFPLLDEHEPMVRRTIAHAVFSVGTD